MKRLFLLSTVTFLNEKTTCCYNLVTIMVMKACIVGSRGASQLGGSLLGIPPGYKANKLIVLLSYPLGKISF